MESIIQRAPVCAGYIGQHPEPKPVVRFELKDADTNLTQRYSMLVSQIQLTHANHNTITPTLGKDIYLYTTGAKQVSISLSGTIMHDACSEEETPSAESFEKLFYTYSTLHRNTAFKMILDGSTYYVYLINCVRQLTASEEKETDQFQLTLIGVRDA